MKEIFSESRDQKAAIFSLSKQLHESSEAQDALRRQLEETEKANIHFGELDKKEYQALEQKHMEVINAAAATLSLAEARLGSTEARLGLAEKARDLSQRKLLRAYDKEKMELEVHAKELKDERDEHENTKVYFLSHLKLVIDKEKNTSEEHANLQVAVRETSKKFEEEIFALRQQAAMPLAELVPSMLDDALGELEQVVREERAKRHQAELRRTMELEMQECANCMDRPNDTALGCGHQACSVCVQALQNCHICEQLITLRIRLYRN
jgi:hypothetical protein